MEKDNIFWKKQEYTVIMVLCRDFVAVQLVVLLRDLRTFFGSRTAGRRYGFSVFSAPLSHQRTRRREDETGHDRYTGPGQYGKHCCCARNP